MAIRPISYVKTHPAATVVTFAAGMMIGPWLFGAIGNRTGVNISLPTVGGGGN
jgi:hypothetical protein